MGNRRCYVFLVLVISFLWDPCLAVSNDTQFEPAFVPEPEGRGTIGILLSGIITLCLCVWTSVHPDVIPNPTTWRIIVNRLSWMLIALLAPELILGTAYNQSNTAKKVHKAWCEHFNVEQGGPEDNMGLEGAFFIEMGGVMVSGVGGDIEKTYVDYTLTSKGFLYYLSKGQIAKDAINKREIVDKGKADILAKLLVCLEVSWMVVQYTARKANGLPITLLELHVVIQVIFVFASYGLWGYKPLNANEPIFVQLEHVIGNTPESGWLRVERGKDTFSGVVISVGTSALSTSSLYVVLSFFIITSGAHASAWNHSFPTPIEQVMWRVSSVALAGPIFLLLIYAVYKNAEKYLSTTLYKVTETTLTYTFLSVFTPFYLFGITFITLEAFISLRKVPLGTYDSVPWTDLWPHF